MSEEFRRTVHTFVADVLGRAGLDPVAVETSEDDRSSLVICENGDVYRVRLVVKVDQIIPTKKESK